MSNNQTGDNWFRRHYKGEFMVYFGNFVSCYFVPGYGYDELPRLAKEYKNDEVPAVKEGLLRELLLLKEKDDWYYIQKFVSKHGMRKLNHEKLKAMVDLLINELSSK